MSELVDKQAVEFRGDPFEMGVIVADRIELAAVTLAESQTWREPNLKSPDGTAFLSFEIDEIAHGKNVAEKKVFVKVTFSAMDNLEGSDDSNTFRVKATFILVYEISSFVDVEDNNIYAFSITNGIYNAWPYWREFLQSTTTRMGLPPVVAPPFRFGGTQQAGSKDE